MDATDAPAAGLPVAEEQQPAAAAAAEPAAAEAAAPAAAAAAEAAEPAAAATSGDAAPVTQPDAADAADTAPAATEPAAAEPAAAETAAAAPAAEDGAAAAPAAAPAAAAAAAAATEDGDDDDDDAEARTKALLRGASALDLSRLLAPVVICGPSGVGKGTIIAELMRRFPGRLAFCVSHTTRGPRPGEADGEHYHFVDQGMMRRAVAKGAFLEHAEVHGNLYGTSLAAVAAVSAAGRVAVLDIDVQGAEQVRASVLGASCLFVFISPPSHAELERRLRGRGTETEDKVLKRLANAVKELEKAEVRTCFFGPAG